MTLEDRRKDSRLRRQLETDYKLERDVVSPYRRFSGVLRGLIDFISISVAHKDMGIDRATQELIVLGVSYPNIERILKEATQCEQ